jgi:hypothetical protein
VLKIVEGGSLPFERVECYREGYHFRGTIHNRRAGYEYIRCDETGLFCWYPVGRWTRTGKQDIRERERYAQKLYPVQSSL